MSATPPCDWCESTPAVEVIVRIRPTSCGGRDRAFSFACSIHADTIVRSLVGFSDVIALYRLLISPLIPASEEASR